MEDLGRTHRLYGPIPYNSSIMRGETDSPMYFSLGRYCAVAYHLRRLGLGQVAGPLDWMGSDDPDGLIRLLRNRFDGFMSPENLLVIGKHMGYWVVVDRRYNIRTAHDFPVDPLQPISQPGAQATQDRGLPRQLFRWFFTARRRVGPRAKALESVSASGFVEIQTYREGIRRIESRARRFLKALESPRPIILVRQEDSMKEILTLLDVLRDQRAGWPFQLLAVGPDPAFRTGPIDPKLRTFPIEQIDSSQGPDSWQGDHEVWDLALSRTQGLENVP